jgi:hypothetical protein
MRGSRHGTNDLAGQVAELTAAGCAKVYREKVSGAKTDRAELAKVIGRLASGDVLVVTRLASDDPKEKANPTWRCRRLMCWNSA